MSEKKVHEIIHSLNDRDNLQEDLDEARKLLSNHFREKYLARLDSAFNKYKKSSAKNPSKEVQLIHAMRPFLPPERHEKLDSLTETLTLLSAFENIRKEANAALPQTPETMESAENWETIEADTAIHADGIYEVDEDCLYRKSRALPYDEPHKNANLNAAHIMLVMGLMRGLKEV